MKMRDAAFRRLRALGSSGVNCRCGVWVRGFGLAGAQDQAADHGAAAKIAIEHQKPTV
jgi:hypothetical protein